MPRHNNVNTLAAKLEKTYIGTPKTSAQRAAESAERKSAARKIREENNAKAAQGSWVNAVKAATARRTQYVTKKKGRNMLRVGVKNRGRQVSGQQKRRNNATKKRRMTASLATLKRRGQTRKTATQRLQEETAKIVNNSRHMGRTRRQTKALKMAAIPEE